MIRQETVEILRAGFAFSGGARATTRSLSRKQSRGMRRNGPEGMIRWPSHPEHYFEIQAEFVKAATIR